MKQKTIYIAVQAAKKVIVLFLLIAFASCKQNVNSRVYKTEVDYKYYSVNEWRSLVGMPDDFFKAYVDEKGKFFTEYGKDKKNVFYVGNLKGMKPYAWSEIGIHADVDGGAVLVEQFKHLPRVPVITTLKQKEDVSITEQAFMTGPLDWNAEKQLDDRQSKPDSRQYLIMTEYVNNGENAVDIKPVLNVSPLPVSFTKDISGKSNSITIADHTRCIPSVGINRINHEDGKVWFDQVRLEPGQKYRWTLAINRYDFPGADTVSWEQGEELREQAIQFWQFQTKLPYGVISVPDPEIQSLIDNGIRDLYQLRCITDSGLPIFNFGPKEYLGYFVLDGSFITEALAMLGQTQDATGYCEFMLSLQNEEGSIMVLPKHWKEPGIALLTLYRHARMTNDKEWLEKHFLQVSKLVEVIISLRNQGTAADSASLKYRLSPGGYGDGGMTRADHFLNEEWLLAGMKAACEAAQWLGKENELKTWEKEYEDYYNTFRAAIVRDTKTDSHGNSYIPAIMGPKTAKFPTRGQWALCQAIYPGRIFDKNDSLMLGTLKMFEANEVQGGIIKYSGWRDIWAQCASFYGHDLLWLGQGRKAADLLYTFANHASPVHNWVEELPSQIVPGKRLLSKSQGINGDQPHVSASAEFIRYTGHLLAFDRGDELHLLEGIPLQWTKPGMVTRLNGMQTIFGPLDLTLSMDNKGKNAKLEIGLPDENNCNKVVVHVDWAQGAEASPVEIVPGESSFIKIPIER